MPREFSRTDRVGSEVQRDLAALIRDELQDPRLGMVTVQEVRVARDFSVARVFFTLMGGALNPAEAADVLNKAAGHLRHLLGRQLRMRTVPELRFEFDESVERGMRLSALIDEAVQSDSAIDPGKSGEIS